MGTTWRTWLPVICHQEVWTSKPIRCAVLCEQTSLHIRWFNNRSNKCLINLQKCTFFHIQCVYSESIRVKSAVWSWTTLKTEEAENDPQQCNGNRKGVVGQEKPWVRSCHTWIIMKKLLSDLLVKIYKMNIEQIWLPKSLSETPLMCMHRELYGSENHAASS